MPSIKRSRDRPSAVATSILHIARTIHDLRAILKALLRRHGLRCIDCREAP
jgi:hypothetical protein